jgi:HAD superfamily hydrolase (TIGR01509 family)
VLIESEYEGNAHLAALLTELGHPTSVETSMARFMGLSTDAFHEAIETWIGGPLPDRFHELRDAENARVLAQGVPPVRGAVDFIKRLDPTLPRAIASSSTSAWIKAHLDHIGLRSYFDDALIFSGREHVTRGKPAPDIYLHAAAALGVPIERTLIAEDSPVGMTGAVASGATVVGLTAGRHCAPGHGAILTRLGADYVTDDFAAIAALLS